MIGIVNFQNRPMSPVIILSCSGQNPSSISTYAFMQ